MYNLPPIWLQRENPRAIKKTWLEQHGKQEEVHVVNKLQGGRTY